MVAPTLSPIAEAVPKAGFEAWSCWQGKGPVPTKVCEPLADFKGLITPFSRPCLRKRAKTLRDGGSRPESVQTRPVSVRAG